MIWDGNCGTTSVLSQNAVRLKAKATSPTHPPTHPPANPFLLPQLRRPETLHWPMEETDSHLIGDICHCLGIFGIAPPRHAAQEAALDAADDAEGEGRAAARRLLAKGRAFLLANQGEDGSWPVRDGTHDAYDRYLSTSSAVGGLLSIRPQGFGPANAALADTLRRVNTAGKGWGSKKKGSSGKKEAEDNKPAPPSVTCCGRRRPLVLKRFDRLASLYTARSAGGLVEVVAHRDGVEEYLVGGAPARTLADPSLAGRVAVALDGLLHWRRQQEARGGARPWQPSPSSSSIASAASAASATSADAYSSQRAQAIARVTAAARGVDRDGFAKELAAYAAAAAAGAGLPPLSAPPPVRVPLSTSTVDLFPLFQVRWCRDCVCTRQRGYWLVGALSTLIHFDQTRDYPS
jgi:hypothetical protein